MKIENYEKDKMNYYLPNGNKWSVESGDWQSHQKEEKKVRTKNRIFALSFAALLLIITSFVIITAFY